MASARSWARPMSLVARFRLNDGASRSLRMARAPPSHTNAPPLEARTTSRSTIGSIPALAPSTRASVSPIMWMKAHWLLTSLATLPAPIGPTWNTLPPMASNAGRNRSNSSASPPTITARVPSRAPRTPPDTGASRNPTPFSAAVAHSSRTRMGEFVDRSMMVPPEAVASSTPPAPSTTSFTSGGAGSDRKQASCPEAAAAGVSAQAAPASSRLAAESLLRSCTVNW